MFQTVGQDARFTAPGQFHRNIETDQGPLLEQMQDFFAAQVEVAHGSIEIAERAWSLPGPSAGRAQIQLGLDGTGQIIREALDAGPAHDLASGERVNI